MSHHEQALCTCERIPIFTYKRHWNLSTDVSLKHVIMFLIVAMIFLAQPMSQSWHLMNQSYEETNQCISFLWIYFIEVT